MQSILPDQNQLEMFQLVLAQTVSPKHELVHLSRKLEWSWLQAELENCFSHTGRPGHPIRRIVGFLILKQLYNVSDEQLTRTWVENIYWQFFTGEQVLQHKCPISPSEMSHFRQKLGEEGIEKIFQASINIHGKKALEKECVCDTTVQEKNITFPTDVKNQRKIIKKCIGIAEKENIQLRRTYKREAKKCLLALRFRNHPKRSAEASRAAKRLKTITGAICRDLERKLIEIEKLEIHKKRIELFNRVLNQKRDDKDKIYSLHEPTVSCIAKGKEHKKYEFGCKVSILTTKTEGIIIGVKNFQGNPHDTKTLPPTLEQTKRLVGKLPEVIICDRGYRGINKIEETKIVVPDPGHGKSDYEKRKSRNQFRRRAGIEPRISHLKYDHRMARNYLKGVLGDAVNLLMAATAWNLRKYLRLSGLLRSFFTWLRQCARDYASNPFQAEFFAKLEF